MTERKRIVIMVDGVWAGVGYVMGNGTVVDCAARLGDSDTQDETERIWDARRPGRLNANSYAAYPLRYGEDGPTEYGPEARRDRRTQQVDRE